MIRFTHKRFILLLVLFGMYCVGVVPLAKYAFQWLIAPLNNLAAAWIVGCAVIIPVIFSHILKED